MSDRLSQIGEQIQAMHERRSHGICYANDQEQFEALIAEAALLSKDELNQSKAK
jgi:hypothetical protein